MRTIFLASALCVGLAACTTDGGRTSSGDPQEALTISPRVWALYKAYTKLYKPLYFAVSADGNVAGGSYCSDRRCVAEMTEGRRGALDNCAQNGGAGCRIFAQGTDISVRYTVQP